MGCCGGGAVGWTGQPQPSWTPTGGDRFAWEVHFPDGTSAIYPTDTQAAAAVAVAGGGMRRIKAPGS